MSSTLRGIYTTLFDHYGPQNWWPGDTPFEVMVGAVLTQNTSWLNVSRAITNLKEENLLSFSALCNLPEAFLAEKIRPSGYYNLKARRLKNLLALIMHEAPSGDLDSFFAQNTVVLREKLLSVKGIGAETADSILLYAAQKPVFVVDAYTYRMLNRHGLVGEETDYEEMQDLFLQALPADDVQLFNEYHALIVRLGKEFCKKTNPLCTQCPLKHFEPLLVD